MRKIVLGMSMSLDGYFEGPDHDISWHQVDDELHQFLNDDLRTRSAFLHGRVTYDLMADVWPTADADPDADGPTAEFAGIWRDMPKYVYSRTLRHARWNTTVVRDVVPAEVEALKDGPGGDLSIGGADLAAAFAAHDLIDAYDIYVHPVLVGRGRRLFADRDALTRLRLVHTRQFGNGVVLLRYGRATS
ncbi:dihydrofolate reductase family protein [Streptomyces sp. V4-01]|uniref:Dihydrofolate reductase family protein n=1 Tax=Actinacidiphila polyblastidii TaxID=3110430 RepID=A0ABU7PL20_9ACTN|nr:dihydrofolate reductase family protein [Streptomyces sp. V4-01]